MVKKRVLTVEQYIDRRGSQTYGKHIRVIGGVTSSWLDNRKKEVDRVKVTDKIIFIYVKE